MSLTLPRSLCVWEPALIPLGEKKPNVLIKRQIQIFWTHFGTRNRKFRAMTQRQKLIHWPPIYFTKIVSIWYNHQTRDLFTLRLKEPNMSKFYTIDNPLFWPILAIFNQTSTNIMSTLYYPGPSQIPLSPLDHPMMSLRKMNPDTPL